MLVKLVNRLLGDGSQRSTQAVKHILISFVAKGISILSTLLVVPLTIAYVNPTQYGIWLTLSSIIAWVYFFDFGLGNGFRNRFAEAKAAGDVCLARQYVSTTYFAIGSIVCVLFVVLWILNRFVDWSALLGVDAIYAEELTQVFQIVSLFFCLQLVVNVFSILLTANQQPGIAAVINGAGNLGALVVVWLLTIYTEGSLTNLALYYSGVPCLVLLIVSVSMFGCSRYRIYAPRIQDIKIKLIPSLLSLGAKFFVIYLCMLVLFQMINLVLSREFGAEAVTQYNIAHKYFAIINFVAVIIITPFWSAFTDAYCRKDYGWMRTTVRKLEQCGIVAILFGGVMLLLSSWGYRIWIGESVSIPFSLSLITLLYVLAQTIGGIYMYLVNGIGTIRIQLISYVTMACVAWPLMKVLGLFWGMFGVLIVPTVAFTVQALLGRIQIYKVLNNRADGIWKK